jgi:hypothetical protein
VAKKELEDLRCENFKLRQALEALQ